MGSDNIECLHMCTEIRNTNIPKIKGNLLAKYEYVGCECNVCSFGQFAIPANNIICLLEFELLWK